MQQTFQDPEVQFDTERVILMGGTCSGQVHTVPAGTAGLTALDAAGRSHEYVRTELTDGPAGSGYRIFRRRAPVG
jgi:hypothetical protein